MSRYKIQPKEIRGMNQEEVKETLKLQELRLMNAEFEKEKFGRGSIPSGISETKKNIARLKTILKEKENND